MKKTSNWLMYSAWGSVIMPYKTVRFQTTIIRLLMRCYHAIPHPWAGMYTAANSAGMKRFLIIHAVTGIALRAKLLPGRNGWRGG